MLLLGIRFDLEKGVIVVDRSYDSNARKVGSIKGRYWRTVPISSSLKSLIIELKQNPEVKAYPNVLPRFKEWNNGD